MDGLLRSVPGGLRPSAAIPRGLKKQAPLGSVKRAAAPRKGVAEQAPQGACGRMS